MKIERVKIMTIMTSIKLALGIVSILLAIYSLLGFARLARFWFQISNLERFQEIFLYMSVFVASFVGVLVMMIFMVVN